MGRARDRPKRPAGIVVACIVDWLVLAAICCVLLIGGRAVAAVFPGAGTVVRFALLICLGVAVLDALCFALVAWAIWVRFVLQILTFAAFAVRGGDGSPVSWILHVLILACWLGALAELSRAGDASADRGTRRRRVTTRRVRR